MKRKSILLIVLFIFLILSCFAEEDNKEGAVHRLIGVWIGWEPDEGKPLGKRNFSWGPVTYYMNASVLIITIVILTMLFLRMKALVITE